MLRGKERPTKRPDLDNCIKSITDALNGIAYQDDSYIVEVIARKWWAEQPLVEITIIELGEG
jgi:Holliday junction resolvase RusA-like endonuclease